MWPGSNFKKVLCQNLSFADSRDRFGGSSLNTSKRLPKSDSISGKKTVSLHSAVLSDSQFDQNILSCKEPLPGVSIFLVGRQAGRQAGSVHEHNFGHKSRGGSRLISSYFCFLCCHILLHIFVCVYLICATSVAPLALNCCEQTCRRT